MLRYILPEALLNEYGGVLALPVALLCFVGAVSVLNETRGLATLLEPLLRVVTPKLRLNENSGLSHLLRVNVLKHNKNKN